MRRRVFIAMLGSAAVMWSSAAHAQKQSVPVIGFLNSAAPDSFAHLVAAFHRGLNEAGFVEGDNVLIEYRWAEGQNDRLPALAADLVLRQVAVLVATAGSSGVAKAATSTIPIVFITGFDPVADGLVTSLSRPGGNLTGLTIFTRALDAKRLEVLHELVPAAEAVAALINPTFRNAELQQKAVEEVASRAGVRVIVLYASAEPDFESAFATLLDQDAKALAVCADPFFNSRRGQLVALAARHRIPAIYEWREFAEAGGLMSYGTSLTEAYRQVGNYAGAILNGAKPAELPVLQPTRVELVINMSTARALGLSVPTSLLVRADEVIQ